jgi:glyoxylase-like metal-dependent hydrolase (beta-lactamase superfamily II)
LEIEVARMVSKAPVRAAVNTHCHLDHTFGNIAYERQKIAIMAHERAPALMKERYAALQARIRPRSSALGRRRPGSLRGCLL